MRADVRAESESSARIFRALSISPTRVEILRQIIDQQEVSTADIMSKFGLTRNGARSHLVSLSTEGLITYRRSTHPRGSGPITYWRPDVDEVALLLDELSLYLHLPNFR
ncbi:FaeA/PapI family transcriptional regulator [Leifsonia kafniensis]|uniref:FaeA/PapI family transcriptional regulator n=1 Tax=Leifsonia kafniensis TaxID=475957 RepID=UPI003CD0613A